MLADPFSWCDVRISCWCILLDLLLVLNLKKRVAAATCPSLGRSGWLWGTKADTISWLQCHVVWLRRQKWRSRREHATCHEVNWKFMTLFFFLDLLNKSNFSPWAFLSASVMMGVTHLSYIIIISAHLLCGLKNFDLFFFLEFSCSLCLDSLLSSLLHLNLAQAMRWA